MKAYRYKNIFLFSSLQFAGNINEYFIKHSEKLVIYITLPRFNNKFNIVRIYNQGTLISEKNVLSSGNIFLYYFYWYFTYIHTVMKYYSKKEHVYVITWQPYFLFAQSLQKLARNIEFVYWIGDYFPPISLPLQVYEWSKKYYAKRIKYACYLSDRINKKINGKVISNYEKKTVSWGIKPLTKHKKVVKREFIICFVGVIKPDQGLEFVIEAIKHINDVKLKILGTGNKDLIKRYVNIIKKNGVANRVYFPNKMFYGDELAKELNNCNVGIAVYQVDKNSATYYADPGKIKTYAQYNLPVIMTPIADVEKYVKKFSSGEIVNQNVDEIIFAIKKIKSHYAEYLAGITKFNEYFDYEVYYKKKFLFLENTV